MSEATVTVYEKSKARRAAAVVLLAVIVIFTIAGLNRSVSHQAKKTAALFDADFGIADQLGERMNAARGLAALAAEDSAVSGYDSGEGSDDSFSAQNAMQAVYEYLKENGEFQNLSISYSANAKGDLYARIGSVSDVQGTDNSYELRLYDNGKKESDSGFCREIVLEKVYTAEDGETELLDFFLVHPETLEVTNEHKTEW